MNLREALRAMSEGKPVRRTTWGPKVRIYVVDDHDRIEVMPPSARDFILVDFMNNAFKEDEMAPGEFEIYEDKNEHPVGTYLWAQEEHHRGKTVSRWDDKSLPMAARQVTVTTRTNWNELKFLHADFIATDWKIVDSAAARLSLLTNMPVEADAITEAVRETAVKVVRENTAKALGAAQPIEGTFDWAHLQHSVGYTVARHSSPDRFIHPSTRLFFAAASYSDLEACDWFVVENPPLDPHGGAHSHDLVKEAVTPATRTSSSSW